MASVSPEANSKDASFTASIVRSASTKSIQWSRTWDALMGGFGSAYLLNTSFQEFVQATRGNFQPEGNRPIRLNTWSDQVADFDINSTLWRRFPAQSSPMFDFNNPAPEYDTNRNEYFRNQKRQRMANMTTQRSSVFAVWITVGYFELEEVPVAIPNNPNLTIGMIAGNPPAAFSNGLVEWRTAVGREYGLDRGQVRRDRAFYVVDRSIPVGFFPGENLNVDKAVLTRRYLP
jgi:hypothetical protein